MYDLTRGVRIPTDLDAQFAVVVEDDEDPDGFVYLLNEGTPIGVHEIKHDGQWYLVTCSVEAIPDKVGHNVN